MQEKVYSEDDLKEIAKEIIDMLRPKHLRVCDIKKILRYAIEKTEYIVLRERAE